MQKKSWSQPEIFRAMETNMRFHMTYFPKYLPNMEILSETDILAVCSPIPDDTFNFAFGAKFTEKNVHERVSHIMHLFQTRHLPFAWWVWQSDTPPQLSILIEHGMHLREEYAGMFLNLEKFQPKFGVPHLRIQRVISQDELKSFAQVITAVGVHPEAYDLVYNKLPPHVYQEGAPYELYLGFAADQPVVTGILVLHADAAGIYYITTTPNERHKGYATAMMEHLLARARLKNYSLCTLQASLLGKHVYERLGFTQCCVVDEFASKDQS